MAVISNQTLSSPVVSVSAAKTSAPKSTSFSASVSQSAPITFLAGDTVSISAVGRVSPNVYARPVVDPSTANQVSVDPGSDSEVPNSSIPSEPDVSAAREEQNNARKADEVGQGGSSTIERRESDASKNTQDDLERQQLVELAIRDNEVRAHEQAHKSVGGQYTGAISLSYQTGPDGKRYAVGGEVPIDVSPVAGDPQATITKMRTVKAAANAPADPSAQDRKVAAAATRLLTRAQIELSAQKSAEANSSSVDIVGSGARDRVAEAAKSYEEITGLNKTDDNKYDAFA